VADEETGSEYGIIYLIQQGIFKSTDMAVVPDSGDSEGSFIEVAEKSMMWLKFKVMGKQTHASMPGSGINAHKIGMMFALSVDEALHDNFSDRDELFEPPFSTYVDFMVNLFDIFKVAFGLDNEIPLNPFPSKLYYTPEEQKLLQQIGAQLREIKKEIEEAKRKLEAGDMTEEEKLALEEKIKDLEAEYEYNVERMQAIIGWPTSAGEIILERFGLNGVVELISWTDDLMQYKANQDETRKMMGELVRFAYDLLAEGISREEAIDKVIERINAKAFRLVDRKKVEDFYVNSPELDDGQMDAMIQELIDKPNS